MREMNRLIKEIEQKKLKKEYRELREHFKNVRSKVYLREGVADVDMSDTQEAMNELEKRFQAAKRGLSIINRLEPGQFRVKHSRRVMGNLNKIRAGLQKIQKQLSQVAS